jgi:hypothetical protein
MIYTGSNNKAGCKLLFFGCRASRYGRQRRKMLKILFTGKTPKATGFYWVEKTLAGGTNPEGFLAGGG